MLRVLVTYDGNLTATAKAINCIAGFKKVPGKTLSWTKGPNPAKSSKKKKNPGGRPYSKEFDAEVWGEVVICALDSAEEVEELKVIANTAYSYEVFRMAAKRVQDRNEKWSKDPLTKNLKFSDKWIWGLIW